MPFGAVLRKLVLPTKYFKFLVDCFQCLADFSLEDFASFDLLHRFEPTQGHRLLHVGLIILFLYGLVLEGLTPAFFVF
jgi:hypothetical protein